jgi:hypothetical protein
MPAPEFIRHREATLNHSSFLAEGRVISSLAWTKPALRGHRGSVPCLAAKVNKTPAGFSPK